MAEDTSQACWYKFNLDTNKKIPVQEPAIAGYLKEARVTVKEYDGEETYKLDLVIAADELYIIRTGLETNFAKSFLLAIAEVEDLSQTLIFACQAGTKNTVFCRLYTQDKNRVKVEWRELIWLNEITRLQARLGQPHPSIKPEPEASLAPPFDRDMISKEIESLLKRKNLTMDEAKFYAKQWTGKQSRAQMTDSELATYRDKLQRVMP
jgi:hypothetical protein